MNWVIQYVQTEKTSSEVETNQFTISGQEKGSAIVRAMVEKARQYGLAWH